MTMNPNPGNHPDTDDMSGTFAEGGEASHAAKLHPDLDEAEDEAAKLGDFA